MDQILPLVIDPSFNCLNTLILIGKLINADLGRSTLIYLALINIARTFSWH